MQRICAMSQTACWTEVGYLYVAGEQALLDVENKCNKAMKRYNRFTQPTCGQAHEVGEQACDPHTVW